MGSTLGHGRFWVSRRIVHLLSSCCFIKQVNVRLPTLFAYLIPTEPEQTLHVNSLIPWDFVFLDTFCPPLSAHLGS